MKYTFIGGSVAQWLACSPCAQEDVGSNPAPAASEKCLIDWHSCVNLQVPVSRIDLKWALYKYITFTFYSPLFFYLISISPLLLFSSYPLYLLISSYVSSFLSLFTMLKVQYVSLICYSVLITKAKCLVNRRLHTTIVRSVGIRRNL